MWPCSYVNKVSDIKANAKDLILKAKAQAKNCGLNAKAKD
jgi:hypothetical protein